jgi:hypothetical protein
VHNLQVSKQGSTIQELPSSIGAASAILQVKQGISCTCLRCGVLTRITINFFSYELLNARKQKKYYQQASYEDKLQCFLNQALRSSFKKLIVSMPSLLQGLYMMSLLKSVPEGLKPQECKRTKLREPPPVPYIPTKDEVQEEVAKLRNLKNKTTIEKDTTLNFPVWHENKTRESFLMHVMAELDVIKKRSHLQDYKKAEKIHKEAKKAVESARAGLSPLNGTGAKSRWFCKKKAKKATEKALAKAPDSKSEVREAKEASKVKDNSMKAGFLEDLEKAKQAQSTVKGAMTAAASKMFMFYSNLLSPESRYLWNKIVGKQTESDPYINLQCDSLEGPRGMSCKSFNDCIMFHLLTVFPINTAEQEKYYISNILNKPQRINVRQFVRRVEQLNLYITQMPCSYYSPNPNASTKPKNVPFTEAELGAHVLCMCPIQWQDQYNKNEKGMRLMDMHLLLTLLEAIKCICTYWKGKSDSFKKSNKSSNKGKKRKKRLGVNSMARVPKKVRFEMHCDLCKKHGGIHTMHNTHDCCRYEKDGKEKSSFCAVKKGGYKSNPVNQNFAQLTNKIKELEKALKKSGKKRQKRHYKDSDSNSELGVGLGSTRKIVKIGETITNASYTAPSPINATPTSIASYSDSDDVSTASVSKAGDVMVTSSSQKGKLLKKNSSTPNKDPSEGRTTTIVAVMRGRPKHGHHHQCSNRHYKQKLVRVLFDSGSDGDLVFVDKDKPMLLPSTKSPVPQLWNTSNGRFQTKQKAEIELLVAPDIVEYDKINKPQYDIILGLKTMKKYGTILEFNSLSAKSILAGEKLVATYSIST